MERRLIWYPEMGHVTMEIVLPCWGAFVEEVAEFTVSPIFASLLICFTEQHRWTLPALSSYLDYSTQTTRRRMQYWVAVGLIKEQTFESNEIGYVAVHAAEMNASSRSKLLSFAKQSNASLEK